MKRVTLSVLLLSLFAPFLKAETESVQIQANQVLEWSYVSQKYYSDPFNRVELNVLVTTPDGNSLRVPAFWAGDHTWSVRYASPILGKHTFQTECSDEKNKSLHGKSGSIDIIPYEGSNPLYKHGPIRVAANKKHFEHQDGTPFFWLADTWWMGLCKRLSWPTDFKMLTKDRVNKGFTVVQIVAGLYPDMTAFDARGANEAGFPWTADYKEINPKYFNEADLRIQWLVNSGMAPCIVGAWGYHLPVMGVDKMKKHWRYIVGRYGAYPTFWSVAGEGIMPFYLSEKRDEDRALQKKGLTELAAYIREIDPYRRPLSIHPTDTARNQLETPSLLDFDMLQTGHKDRASIPKTIEMMRNSRAGTPQMPTINSEVCYEGILGASKADIQRFMFWSCVLSGAAGHTYGANGIWQVNRPNQPYGKSPRGNDWGQTPWKEAMELPGSGQLGIAKKILECHDWWKFESRPEWVSYTKAPDDNSVAPFASGIDRKVRLIYIPSSLPTEVRQLEADVKYKAVFINPQTGESIPAGEASGDSQQTWIVPDFPKGSVDWLLQLQAL